MSWYFFQEKYAKFEPLNELTIASGWAGDYEGWALPILVLCLCTACASGHVDTPQKGTAPDQISDCGVGIRLIELRLHIRQWNCLVFKGSHGYTSQLLLNWKNYPQSPYNDS